jgi:hypothetical protein
MFKGAALFLLIFIAITPQSRDLSQMLSDVLLAAGLLASIVMVKTWPARVEPENPMTKYKKQVPFEE